MYILNSLAALSIMSYIMIALALLGVVLLLVFRKAQVSRVIISLMAMYGVLVAYINYTGSPSDFGTAKILALLWGAIGVLGMIVGVGSKKPNGFAKLLVAASVLIGIADIWFF